MKIMLMQVQHKIYIPKIVPDNLDLHTSLMLREQVKKNSFTDRYAFYYWMIQLFLKTKHRINKSAWKHCNIFNSLLKVSIIVNFNFKDNILYQF